VVARAGDVVALMLTAAAPEDENHTSSEKESCWCGSRIHRIDSG
jgi:hypothetical protein